MAHLGMMSDLCSCRAVWRCVGSLWPWLIICSFWNQKPQTIVVKIRACSLQMGQPPTMGNGSIDAEPRACP